MDPSTYPRASFRVEKIIAVSILEDNLKFYKVQWAPSWVAHTNLDECENLIAEFLGNNKTQQIQAVNSECGNIHPASTIKVEENDDEDIIIYPSSVESSGTYGPQIDISRTTVEHVEEENPNVMYNNVGSGVSPVDATYDMNQHQTRDFDYSLSVSHVQRTSNTNHIMERTHKDGDFYPTMNQIQSTSTEESWTNNIDEYGTSVPPDGAIHSKYDYDLGREIENNMPSMTQKPSMPEFIVDSEGVFNCPECPRKFAQKYQMVRHYAYHTKPFRCDECHKCFGRKDNLKRHQMQHRSAVSHNSPANVKCLVCEAFFTDQNTFLGHFREHHDGDPSYSYQVVDPENGFPPLHDTGQS